MRCNKPKGSRKTFFRGFCGFQPYKADIGKSFRTYEYPEDWDEIRKAVLKRDNYTCQRCKTYYGSKRYMLTVHHKVALSRGGSSRKSNLVTLCRNCHREEHPHLQQRYQQNKERKRNAQ